MYVYITEILYSFFSAKTSLFGRMFELLFLELLRTKAKQNAQKKILKSTKKQKKIKKRTKSINKRFKIKLKPKKKHKAKSA